MFAGYMEKNLRMFTGYMKKKPAIFVRICYILLHNVVYWIYFYSEYMKITNSNKYVSLKFLAILVKKKST